MKTYADFLDELIHKNEWSKQMTQVEAILMTRILDILRDHDIIESLKKEKE